MNLWINLPLLPSASLWTAFVQSSLIGQTIATIQIVMSISVWSIMLGKRQELRQIQFVASRFRELFDKTHEVLEIYFHPKRNNNPIALIYYATCEKLVKLFHPEAHASAPTQSENLAARALTARDLTLVKGTTEQSLAEQLVNIERGMNMLATGATAAPLLGLLGTVWGLLDAFQAMGGKGSAMLTDVAPGISSAMLTTVIGLFVAIPSSIGYNALLGRIRNLSIGLDGFADELLGRISCEFQGRDS